jgi:hypothetical protein
MSRENLTRYVCAVVVGLLLVSVHRCIAQEPARDHSCTVQAAGIFASPEGSDGQNFNRLGWGFQGGGGVTFSAPPPRSGGWQWFITANYMYNRFETTTKALDAAKAANSTQLGNATGAHGRFSAVTLDLTPRYVVPERHNFYLTGGFGWLRRGIGFTGANPGTLLQSSEPSLDRLSSNSGVFDLVVGSSTSPPAFHGLMVFAEARVYRGLAINSGSTLVPISVGVRW